MKWIIVKDYEALSIAAARALLEAVRVKGNTVLGLPTGGTPQGMYRNIISECRRGEHCFDEVTTFNLDEYVGISPWHPSSYSSYMREHLFSHVDIKATNIHLPDGNAAAVREDFPGLSLAEALEAECSRYEKAIADCGSLQLTFLGLGRNGHIGFNEPGTAFDARTRVVELTESTRAANAPYFPDGAVPERAITMGIGTILDSAAIVLLASGSAKREAVQRLRTGEPSTDFPASALTSHPDVTIIVDRAAAGQG